MRIHRLFITLFFQIFLVNGDSISYEEALLLKIYDNREHIRNIYSDCYNVTCCNSVSCSTVIYRDTCPFENKDLLLSLLDSAYTSWEKYRSEIIASVFSLRGDNVLLRTAMNKSRVINDSLYVYLLSCYLGLNDSRLKNSALDVLLNNTAYIQLKKNSKAIKQGLKEGEFDNKSEEKEKRLKLLALLDLSEKEKAMILNDNLLTKRQRMRIEEKIKKHKGEVNNSLTLESYCIKENIRYVLPLELKARLGEVNAAYELMKIYDLHATNNKKLLSKKMRELGEQYPIYPPELIVENLIYTGLDTCLKYLILNFNAPLYKYREVMVSINPKYEKESFYIPEKYCSMRQYIIKGFRKIFPNNTLINKTFDEVMELSSSSPSNVERLRKKNFRVGDFLKYRKEIRLRYVKKFKEWAYAKFGVKPKDPDLSVGLF